ncbi:MAG: amidase [Chloroflexi bacterium]|nr:amidase [Chloroflexota bacterium]
MTEEINFLSTINQKKLLLSKQISCEELVNVHLDQIDKYNPLVNAIVTLSNELAINQAKDIDNNSDKLNGILAGLPVAVKDLEETSGIRTTFGSQIYADNIPNSDSLIVKKVKESGAIIIGKSNTPEFGAGSQTFNEVFWSTKNPYSLDKTCGGSSGGSAVALACGMVPLATGSDLGGSLRNPAAWSNIVGFRPSLGRVPAYDDLGWSTLSTGGPMGRQVIDILLQLVAMSGYEKHSPSSFHDSTIRLENSLHRNFNGTKIAWAKNLNNRPIEPEIYDNFLKQKNIFETIGCKIIDDEPDLSESDQIFQAYRAYSYTLKHKEHIEKNADKVKETILWNYNQGKKMSAYDMAKAESLRTKLWGNIMKFFEKYDYLIMPVTSVPPFSVEKEYVDEINGVKLNTYLDWMWPCYTISVTGLPSISIPSGFTDSGLPIGLQIIGKPRKDFSVLELAQAYENITEFYKVKPNFISDEDN